MVEMTIDSVRVSMGNGQRVVILKDLREERHLFIWITADLAMTIAQEMQGTKSQRPLTHDLLKNIIAQLGGKVIQIAITDLRKAIYYATITIEVGGQRIEIDARPSDAIALAVRVKCPIYAAERVLEEAGVLPEGLEGPARSDKRSSSATSQDNLEVYRSFIESLDVLDDFGKPE